MALGGFLSVGGLEATLAPQGTSEGQQSVRDDGLPSGMRDDYSTDESNIRLPSTTWEWKRVIITGPARPKGQRAAGAHSSPLVARDPRKPITISVEYRGGPEAKWRIRARGRTWNFSGVTSFQDIMAHINATIMRPPR